MTFVVDSSAVLALILAEEGADEVLGKMAEGQFSAVNLSEVIAKLIEYGVPSQRAVQQIARLELTIHSFDPRHAEAAARLRQPTRHLGLSLGDRACLALGQLLALPILTSDRRMHESRELLGLDIRMIC